MGKKNIVVIGSGLAGTIICNELVRTNPVTLLEAGLKDSVQYPHIEFIRKNFGVVKTFCTGGGGTTNLWHNGLMPLNIDDINSLEFKRLLIQAAPYMDSAAFNLYFGNRNYSKHYHAALSEMHLSADSLGVFTDGLDCLLYPKKFKKLGVDARVKAHYGVCDIKFTEQNGKIQSISFLVGTDPYTFKTDVVIICAGALGTPYLVEKLICGSGHTLNKIGVGLADHPMGFMGKVKIKKQYSTLFRKLSVCDKGSYVYRTAVRIRSDCGKYTGCVYFRPALTMQNRLSIYKYKSSLGASKGADRIRNAVSPKILHPDILAEIYSHLLGVNITSRIYNILFLFEQKRGTSRVGYNDSGIAVDWFVTKDELALYNSMLRKLTGMLSEISDDMNMLSTLTDEWIWSAAHHSGTIPIGNLPNGLIDNNLQFNLLSNVYICDGSVIQEHSYANTGLTIGMLAMRLAERVRRE